jgi:hypothetical protein
MERARLKQGKRNHYIPKRRSGKQSAGRIAIAWAEKKRTEKNFSSVFLFFHPHTPKHIIAPAQFQNIFTFGM